MAKETIPWLATARLELGTKEIEGDNDNPKILEYHRLGAPKLRAQSDEIPWCAAFVGWVLHQHGIQGTGLATARSYLNFGVSTKPRPGAIVILRRGNSSWQGHVGFYINSAGALIELLGGNQNNQVSIAKYGKKNILGYRWHPTFDALIEKANSWKTVLP
jgi:uncharacterized protein (TIGR02594 family)